MAPDPPLTRSKRISLYHPSIRPLIVCRSLRCLLQVHSHLIVTARIADPFAASRLVKASAAISLPYSLLLFRHLPNPDTFSLNTILNSLSVSPSPDQTLPFFFANTARIAPNSYSFPPLSVAAARSHNVSLGETVHCQAIKRGAASGTHVSNSIIHAYCCCSLISSARMVFDEMRERDLVSWNSLLSGYVGVGDMESAREVFDGMPDRHVVSWNVMIGGCLRRRGEITSGLALVRAMMRLGVKGSVVTVAVVAAGCGRGRWLREGRAVHGYYVRNFCPGSEDDLKVGTAVVGMYVNCGREEIGRRVFDKIGEKNLVCWNTMVSGYCIHGKPGDGLALFQKMVREGEGKGAEGNGSRMGPKILPDEITFVGVLCACARGGFLVDGKKYFEEMTSLYHLKPTFAHYWCMANLYAGLGLVQDAEEVLKGMPEDTESLVWSSLLGYCRFRGDTELGEKISKQLIELEPDNASRYKLLWNIYMAANRKEDAKKVEETMKERGLRAMPDGRLVDLNDIVHNFKVGDRSQPEIEEIYMLMDELAVKLNLVGKLCERGEQ